MIPPEATDAPVNDDDVLPWMQRNAALLGDIFRAKLYGQSVYVVNSPDFAEHVLLQSWQSYLRKGRP